MRKFLRKFLIIITLLISPMLLAQESSPPEAHVFRSLADAKNHLGNNADQIPGYFDFKRYALVWVPHGLPLDVSVKIHELKPPESFEFYFGMAYRYHFEFEKNATVLTVHPNAPCSGGMKRTKEGMKACLAGVTAKQKEAVKTVNLFAIPTRFLKGFKTKRGPMPKRP